MTAALLDPMRFARSSIVATRLSRCWLPYRQRRTDMSTDFLRNPLSLFDIRDKTAIVTGATGAFGALAAKVLAGAGTKLVLAAGRANQLDTVAGECRALGAAVETINVRPSSAANCQSIVKAAVDRCGGVDILVLASGKNDVAKITDMSPERFL